MIIQVTPRAMLNAFFRRRYIFASFFLLVFGLAATFCIIRPPRYESDAELLVKFADVQQNQNTSLPDTGIAAAQLERQMIINSQIAVLQSQDILVDLLNTVTIGTMYPMFAAIPDPKVRLATVLDRLNGDLD